MGLCIKLLTEFIQEHPITYRGHFIIGSKD